MSIHYINSPIGTLKIEFNKRNIIEKIIFHSEENHNNNKNNNNNKTNTKVQDVLNPIINYFKGDKINDINIDEILDNLTGTVFQKNVWRELLKIPFGETKTYSDIALSIGKPLAVRAVANACGKNYVSILIPCHRVIGKNNIGEYAWGTDKKRWLLELEKINSKK